MGSLWKIRSNPLLQTDFFTGTLWCAGEDLGFVTLGLGFYQYERDVCQRGRICATEPGGASSQAVL